MLFSRKKAEPGEAQEPPGQGLFGRLRDALSRTRSALADGVAELFQGERKIDGDLLDEVESLLLSSDMGVEVTERLIEGLNVRLRRKALADSTAVFEALREDMLELLRPVEQPLEVPNGAVGTFSILVCGVNGAGKTTTIGKLAHRLKASGHSVMLAAGDTFRAAAIEQLQAWGERNQVTVVAQAQGADSASVVYDALESARSKHIDVLIADTAGRLHTQAGLMQELMKVRRVMAKVDPQAPHERLLVIDAITGQNALVQAQEFLEAVDLTGIVVTKLDGSAKGGIVFAIAHRLRIPIRFIGVGEGVDDLREFEAEEFVDALLSQ